MNPLNAGQRRGFTLYLAFLVTTVLFLLVLGSSQVARASLDLGRSSLLETIAFHAADGGLERGMARIATSYKPDSFTYEIAFEGSRKALIRVEIRKARSGLDLTSEATITEGAKPIARKVLSRRGLQRTPGRRSEGRFLEES